jgi:hypothetical protein
MSSDFITRQRLEKSLFCHVYTSFGVWLRDHYKAFQWLPPTCNVPTEISSEVLAMTKLPRAPSCVLWGLATTKPTHLQLDGLCSNTIHTTGWYVKTSLYHIVSQVIPIYANGCTVFMCGRSINRSLDLGMIINQRSPATTRHNPKLPATSRHNSHSCHPKS